MAITIKPDIGKILEEIRKGLTDFGAWVTARNDLKDKTEFAKYLARVKFFITKCEQIYDSLKANENKLSEEDKVKTNKIYDEITLKWEELQGIIALKDQLHWPTARATAVSFARYLKGRKVPKQTGCYEELKKLKAKISLGPVVYDEEERKNLEEMEQLEQVLE